MTGIEQRIRDEYDRFGEPPSTLGERLLSSRVAPETAPGADPLTVAPTVTVVDDRDGTAALESRPAPRRRRSLRLVGALAIGLLLAAAVLGVGLHPIGAGNHSARPAIGAGAVPVEQAPTAALRASVSAPGPWAAPVQAAVTDLQVTTVKEVWLAEGCCPTPNGVLIIPTDSGDPAREQFDASLVAAAVIEVNRSIGGGPLDGVYFEPTPGHPPEPLGNASAELPATTPPARDAILAAVDAIARKGPDQAGAVHLDRIELRGTAPTVLISAHVDAAPVGAGVDTTAIDRVMAGLPPGTSWLVEVTDPTGQIVATDAVTPFGGVATASAGADGGGSAPAPVINTPAGDPASAAVEEALSTATAGLPHDAIRSTSASTTRIVIDVASGGDETTFVASWEAELLAIQTRALALRNGAEPPPRFEVHQGDLLLEPGRDIPTISAPWTTADAAQTRAALAKVGPTLAAIITFVPDTGAAVVAHISADAGPNWWTTIVPLLRKAIGPVSPHPVPILLYLDAPTGLQIEASIPTANGEEALGMSAAVAPSTVSVPG